jgi:hypothetical protein
VYSKETSRGFAAKLIEGIKLEIEELHFTIQTLGPQKVCLPATHCPPCTSFFFFFFRFRGQANTVPCAVCRVTRGAD